MAVRLPRISASDDSGVTLVEVIIASMLTVILLAVAGGMIIGGSRTERQTSAIDTAASTGIALTSSLSTSIRNASAVRLSANGVDQYLTARVASQTSTLTWSCVMWYYQASSKSVRIQTSSTAIAMPSSTTLAGWQLLAADVVPKTGSTIFTSANTTTVNVAYSFLLQPSGVKPIEFTSSATSRFGANGSPPCF